MHVPFTSSDNVLPDTEHTVAVVEVKLTGSPEVAVAVSVRCVPAYCVPVTDVKLMVWATPCTAKLCPVATAA